MLSAVLKEHQATQLRQKMLILYKRQLMSKAVDDLVVVLLRAVDENVCKTYHNQRRLSTEIKQLTAKVQVYNQQVKEWLRLVDDFNKTFKELGDVENWTARMERDTLILDGCLRLALNNSSYVKMTGAHSTLLFS
ncbi:Biogenesis of lysosome organelles complex 1 subunit 1 [Paragonimus heterotremus]|uniref:Biogenesis of lysosome-related organelles complex 1 subunit 1 n=1 Tax=Paragonimus heterotremus TaxID=100268 RepID=A0A8J4TD43_9TREM|nr:Biogenesis of lysosome organelles complex 1 subunit 1 [Paragonimus heterotremus]